MERQTLDMEGARRGELSAASLQMGDDTIAIQRIATMSVESKDFLPWDTPANRKVQALYATFFVMNMFFGLVALGWWGLLPGRASSGIALFVGAALVLLALILGGRAMMIAQRLKKREPYFRLIIGTSDGRQIPLVDNNRDVLCRIRDVVRHKLDTDDRETCGDFDLDLDVVNLRAPSGPARQDVPKLTRAEEIRAEAEVLFDEEVPPQIKTAS